MIFINRLSAMILILAASLFSNNGLERQSGRNFRNFASELTRDSKKNKSNRYEDSSKLCLEELQFASGRLASLFRFLCTDLPHTAAIDSIKQSDSSIVIIRQYSKMIHGKPFVAKIEARDNTITHVGMALFNTDAQWQYNFVTRFLERFLLELFMERAPVAIEKASAEQISIVMNGSSFEKGGLSDASLIIPVLQSPSSCVIELKSDEFHRKWFKSTWKDDKGNTVAISFPSRWDIVAGKDKREIDSALLKSLSSFRPDNDSVVPVDFKKIERSSNDLYVLKGDQYFEALDASRFFSRKNGKYLPIIDKNYPKQSIANLLLGQPSESNRIKLDLCFKNAHEQVNHDTVPLKIMAKYFGREHDAYVGFEKETADSVETVVVYVNKTYNLLHMVSFCFPLSQLKPGISSIIPAAIHPNIPNDNVNALFGKYTFKKQKKYSIIISKSDKAIYAPQPK